MSWHPNRTPFEGVLTLVDVASDQAPSGARGHRVILTREAAVEAIPSLLGMAVDYKSGWDGHDCRQKCGVIETAELVGAALHVGGYLFGRDFPDVVATVRGLDTLGMSYELADAHVTDMRQRIWTLNRATFTGAAVLLREKAAYRRTSFRLVPDEQAFALAAAAGRVLRSIVPEEDEFEEAGFDEETWEEVHFAGAE